MKYSNTIHIDKYKIHKLIKSKSKNIKSNNITTNINVNINDINNINNINDNINN